MSHSDAAGRWADTERLFTLRGDEEEVVKWRAGEAAKCLLKEDKLSTNTSLQGRFL